ncbi:ABC transporter ATP-binding protein [Haematobacter missouriensis]|uniref:ABC transporter ATP-binding protein n=1 Tax=Haematobacter missouriensis TaxID=366616 RepID=A0A212ALC9_9RHOB|nr:ATP-binding cassette domain-containing protein [Haematobacter missouriensis]KFI32465.1 ABC transporter ATP-binding protein [Haematobacter missouriensis]OWJ76463.1 ABC transporter ATP-binding protein [Haematobacter missouriensis]OWJ82265.1 ABC transporter ATP-binding protein [Haematobacter missouriensis]
MGEPLLLVDGLGHRYDGPVLDGITFTLRRGGVTVLLGPSGCGKTTLLRLIAGLEPVQSGRVLIDGAPPRPGFGTAMVFQDARLLPWRTVADNLAVVMPAVPRRRRPARIAALLEQVGLSGAADAWPEQLSGGMQQRLALARVLATDAPLILMDEPFASLDALAREEMQEVTLRLAGTQSGRAILFVTHSIEEALVMADDILLLSPRPGRVRHVVTPALGPRGAGRRHAPAFAQTANDLRDALTDPIAPIPPAP